MQIQVYYNFWHIGSEKPKSVHMENKLMMYVVHIPSIGVICRLCFQRVLSIFPLIPHVLRLQNILATRQIYVLHTVNTLYICCTYIAHTLHRHPTYLFLFENLISYDVSEQFIFSHILCAIRQGVTRPLLSKGQQNHCHHSVLVGFILDYYTSKSFSSPDGFGFKQPITSRMFQ